MPPSAARIDAPALSPDKCRAVRQRRGHGETLDVRADSKPRALEFARRALRLTDVQARGGGRPRYLSRGGTHMFLRLPTIVRDGAWIDFGARHLDGDILLHGVL